jgi:hypothetical protein
MHSWFGGLFPPLAVGLANVHFWKLTWASAFSGKPLPLQCLSPSCCPFLAAEQVSLNLGLLEVRENLSFVLSWVKGWKTLRSGTDSRIQLRIFQAHISCPWPVHKALHEYFPCKILISFNPLKSTRLRECITSDPCPWMSKQKIPSSPASAQTEI